MKRLILALSLILPSCGEQLQMDHFATSNTQWQALFLDGKHEAATEALERVPIDSLANDARLVVLLGDFYAKAAQIAKTQRLIELLKNATANDQVLSAVLQCVSAQSEVAAGLLDQADRNSSICYEAVLSLDTPIEMSLMADLSHLRGLVLHERGMLDDALQLYNLSEHVRPSNSWDFEPKLAATINNKANILRTKGLLGEALIQHHRSLELKRRSLSPDHEDISHSLNNIGTVLNDLGRYDEALKYHIQSLEQRKRLGSSSRFIGHSYHNLAISLAQQETIKAIAYVDSAIASKSLSLPPDHPDILNSLSLKADLKERLGETDAAMTARTHLMSLCGKSSYFICHEITYNYLKSIIWSDNFSLSKEFLELIHQHNGESDHSVETSIEFAKWQARQNQMPSALRTLSSVLLNRWGLNIDHILEHRFSSLNSPLLLATVLNEYSHIRLMNRPIDPSDYVRIASIARFTLELIENDLARSIPETDHEKYEKVGKRAAELGIIAITSGGDPSRIATSNDDVLLFSDYLSNWEYQAIIADISALKRSGADSDELDEYKRQISIKSTTVDSSRTELVNRYPLFQFYRPRFRPYATQVLKHRLRTTKSSCVTYLDIEDNVFAVVINQKQTHIVYIGKTKDLLNTISKIPKDVRINDINEYNTLSAAYDSLFKPLEQLVSNDNIIVVRNDFANRIPFEALLTQPITANEPLQYLILDRSVSYTYSIASLVQLRDNNSEKKYFEKDLLAVSPTFDTKGRYSLALEHYLSRTTLTGENPSSRLASLPGALREVSSVSEIMERRESWFSRLFFPKTHIMSGNKSSESTLKSLDLRSYRVIHFATHSFANTRDADSSAIVVNVNEIGMNDGLLHAGEIRNLNISAELVVLSSCEGALEPSGGSSSFAGFSSSFLYAGAQNLVASMWPSDDVGTQILMQHFYTHLASGKASNQALRLAKLDLLEMGGPIANPYYWAGFIHLGAPDALVSR
jgi:CHAT domain-containing protein